MILDEIDLQILKEFSSLKENEFFTLRQLVRKIYLKGKSREDMRIKQKIERMGRYGVFKVEGKPAIYTLDSDRVYLRKFSFPNRRCNALAILIDDKWEVFEL